MIKSIVTALALLWALPACAQTKYVPFTVDEQTFKEVLTYLGEQPYKFSAPLTNWLMQAEAKAAAEAAKSEAKPLEPPK